MVLAHKHKVKPGAKENLYDFIQAKLVYVIRNQHSCDYCSFWAAVMVFLNLGAAHGCIQFVKIH